MAVLRRRATRGSAALALACLAFPRLTEAEAGLRYDCAAYIDGEVSEWDAGGEPNYEMFIVIPDWVEDSAVKVDLGSSTTGIDNCWNVHNPHLLLNSLHFKLGARQSGHDNQARACHLPSGRRFSACSCLTNPPHTAAWVRYEGRLRHGLSQDFLHWQRVLLIATGATLR